MTNPTSYPEYAVVDLETGAIYGVGEDLAHARADAREELRKGRVDDLDEALARLSVARITVAAAQSVRDCGGAPDARKLSVGTATICLRDEEE
jgi:hypothetical protein